MPAVSLYAGMIEYWSADTYQLPAHPTVVAFSMKLDTDLYALAKAKTAAHSLAVSADGSKFVAVAADGCGAPCCAVQRCAAAASLASARN